MIPAWFPDIASSERFWERWWWETEVTSLTGEAPLPTDLECRFDVDDEHAVVVTADAKLWGMNIALRYPGSSSDVVIGFDDEAHWHPHAIRWEELESVARAASLRAGIPHPGLAVLILSRFAPFCVDDDTEEVVGLLEEAWATVPAVDDAAVTRYIERLDHRQDGFRWRETPRGWVIEQPDDRGRAMLYTLRKEGNEDFPWDGTRAVAEAARRAAPPEQAPRHPPTRRLRVRRILQLTVFGEIGRRWQALDTALHDAGIGSASLSGGIAVPIEGTDPRVYETRESHVHVVVHGDLEPALHLLRPLVADLGLEVELCERNGPDRTEISI